MCQLIDWPSLLRSIYSASIAHDGSSRGRFDGAEANHQRRVGHSASRSRTNCPQTRHRKDLRTSHRSREFWFKSLHCGLHCALGGSLGINITSFPLHCSLWNIQSEKHFSAYFQMLWNYLYPILTHFYWIKSFMSLEYKRREIWENKVKNTAKLSYI